MPDFLKFYEGAVSYSEYWSMDHAHWLHMKAVMDATIEAERRELERLRGGR